MTGTDDYLGEFCAFLQTQDYLGPIAVEELRRAQTRDDLGFTSLAVIMLVVNFMEARGVPTDEFDSEWVGRLESVEGIISVLRDIGLGSRQPAR
jgi:hypothetical protein